jgi:hypothetical protein
VGYDKVERIAGDGERLYIYVGAITAFIVPLAVFPNEQAKLDFINQIKLKNQNVR